jgi:tetratricopeptide (TPR) repeat protein
MIKLINIDEDEWEFEDDLINSVVHDELDRVIGHWHSGECGIAEFILKGIISKNVHHIDAYHHLSLIYEETERDFEAYLCCREATRIGLEAIPDGFSWESSKLPWFHLDNRPFLRAYHTLGLWLERRKEVDESIKVFNNMLSICPNDNIGVRYLLPKLFLERGDLLSVIRHCKKHAEDYSPEIMYTYPLALILSGEVAKAKPLLVEAKLQLPLVAKELKKKRHTKPKSSYSYGVTVGGVDQAYEYWKEYGKFWSNSLKAMELISGI